MTSRPVRLAVEGCGHGTLNAIYASIAKSCEKKGWEGVDLLVIGGDFQAVRNAADLKCMAVPVKYREIGDFWEYYAGKRQAPYLTVFVGGNHEASNHLFELYYGGWVAPNIYYLGAANVLRFGPLRLAGLSGIWKGYNYNKLHFERLPYNQDDVRSIYHVRELDVRKLLQLRTQVDVGLSHDWPRGVEWLGDHKWLFQKKDLFEADARSNNLGSVAARLVLDRLRPPHWFSAHLHIKYPALIDHEQLDNASNRKEKSSSAGDAKPKTDELVKNNDEIDLDLEESVADTASGGVQVQNGDEIALDDVEEPPTNIPGTNPTRDAAPAVSEEIRKQLPAAFQDKPSKPEPPNSIHNKTTKFLALDKCLPRRDFLQLLELDSTGKVGESEEPWKLEYDPEWLAITRAFARMEPLQLGNRHARKAPDQGRGEYGLTIDAESEWVSRNIVEQGKLAVPLSFEPTAAIYKEAEGIFTSDVPVEYTNPQTSDFCSLLDIPNPFDITEEERSKRQETGPPPEAPPIGERNGPGGFNHRGGRGGRRGRGGSARGPRGRGRAWR